MLVVCTTFRAWQDVRVLGQLLSKFSNWCLWALCKLPSWKKLLLTCTRVPNSSICCDVDYRQCGSISTECSLLGAKLNESPGFDSCSESPWSEPCSCKDVSTRLSSNERQKTSCSTHWGDLLDDHINVDTQHNTGESNVDSDQSSSVHTHCAYKQPHQQPSIRLTYKLPHTHGVRIHSKVMCVPVPSETNSPAQILCPKVAFLHLRVLGSNQSSVKVNPFQINTLSIKSQNRSFSVKGSTMLLVISVLRQHPGPANQARWTKQMIVCVIVLQGFTHLSPSTDQQHARTQAWSINYNPHSSACLANRWLHPSPSSSPYLPKSQHLPNNTHRPPETGNL